MTVATTQLPPEPTYIGGLLGRLVVLVGERLPLLHVSVPAVPLHPLLLRRLLK